MSLRGLFSILKGGSGSGNIGHGGILGHRGGSTSKGGKFTSQVGMGRDVDLKNLDNIKAAIIQREDKKKQSDAEDSFKVVENRVVVMVNGARKNNMMTKPQISQYKKIMATQGSTTEALSEEGHYMIPKIETTKNLLNLLYDIQDTKNTKG